MTPLEKAAMAAGEVAIFEGSDGRIATLSGGLSYPILEAIARAVLMAVREPDDGMIGAWWGDSLVWSGPRETPWASGEREWFGSVACFKDAHTAMIDHILRGGE